MIPEFETIEDLARRARAERSLYIAELIATGVMALDGAIRKAWDRGVVALLRSRPAISRQAAAARR